MVSMRKIIIVYSMFMGLVFGCKPAKLSNPCDIKSKDFFYGTLIRFVTEDRSPSCYPSFDFQNLWGVFMPTPPSIITSVNAMTSYNDQIIIGGNFQFVGPSTGNVVHLETATGKVLPNRYCPYLKVVGGTQTAISDGSGGFYIGGSFFGSKGKKDTALPISYPVANWIATLMFQKIQAEKLEPYYLWVTSSMWEDCFQPGVIQTKNS